MKNIGKQIYFNARFLGLRGMLRGQIINERENKIKVKGVYSYPVWIDKKVLNHKETRFLD